MDVPSAGIEEELLLVDPVTRRVQPRSPAVLAQSPADEDRPESEGLDAELFQHQVEIQTAPRVHLVEVLYEVRRARRTARAAAGATGLVTAAAGTMPTRGPEHEVTREDRYLDMAERYGDVARPAGTCGMHVHVQIGSEQDGVVAIDRLAPWLPVVLAVTSNSPFHSGRDTGYARRGGGRSGADGPARDRPSGSGTVERYREVSRRLIESGAARDPGMLSFDARLSGDNPTLEVRVSDVCTDPEDGVLVAALVRALVLRSRSDPEGGPAEDGARWRSELLRAAQWRASRYGLGDRLLDPRTGVPAPARHVLASLLDEVRPQLEAAGDLDLADEGVERVLRGTGATHQRAAYERSDGSLDAVVDDLVARTA